jgi:hypothetical protein
MLVILYSLYGRTDGYSPDELRQSDGRDAGGEESG